MSLSSSEYFSQSSLSKWKCHPAFLFTKPFSDFHCFLNHWLSMESCLLSHKYLSTGKQMHNLKVESYFLFGGQN